MQKKVALNTLGCRLNLSETGSIAQGFVDRGYQVVPFGEPADIVFLNTCTVTDSADSTCRNLIRKAHRSSPEAQIVVSGCYAQMEPELVANMQGVDLVLGTNEKFKVFDYLDQEEEQKIRVDQTNEFWGAATTESDFHTRAFLKIQDGCNYICSFCIIPFARGRSRTIEPQAAYHQALHLVEKGFKEIVLTGVNIGEYESTSGHKLPHLISKVLNIKGLKRLRLSSVEPNTITDELLNVLKSSEKFMPHFHIPLQSGSDEILSSMRRKYDVAKYRTVVEKIKNYFPDAALGGDTIVGYPGETKKHFDETLRLVEELGMTHLHVFPYSKRKGTTATKLSDHIPHQEKKLRVKTLIEVGERQLEELAKSQVGKTLSVLFEQRDKDGFYTGHTPNYLRVKLETNEDLKNQIREVKVVGTDGPQLLVTEKTLS